VEKLHNPEELKDLYSQIIILAVKSRRVRWAGHLARMGERRCVCRILVGKPEGKRKLGKSGRRWKDTKIYLPDMGWAIWNRMTWFSIRSSGGFL
jgi:hypothetical protein